MALYEFKLRRWFSITSALWYPREAAFFHTEAWWSWSRGEPRFILEDRDQQLEKWLQPPKNYDRAELVARSSRPSRREGKVLTTRDHTLVSWACKGRGVCGCSMGPWACYHGGEERSNGNRGCRWGPAMHGRWRTWAMRVRSPVGGWLSRGGIWAGWKSD
jgi:hypothetical protein